MKLLLSRLFENCVFSRKLFIHIASIWNTNNKPREGKKVKIQNKLLFAISIISILIVVFQLWSTIPEIGEYTDGRKWLLVWDPETEVYEWLLTYNTEASYMLLETSLGLILNVLFFALVAFWTFSETLGKEEQPPAKPETA